MMSRLIALLLLLHLCSTSVLAADMLLIDDFSGDLSRWQKKVFVGAGDYRLVMQGTEQVLSSRSQASAVALIQDMSVDPKQFPVLSWRWKVDHVLKKGDARYKESDDYAARIYVIFPHWFRPMTRAINYVWASRLPQGEVLPNAYYSRSIVVAVESGEEAVGRWVTERRNLLEDYRTYFGEEPPDIGAIAIMSDTDNTKETAQAWFDDLRLLRH